MRRAGGGTLPNLSGASVLIPAGRSGPAFMVFKNFRVLLTYNNAESYGIGIGHLSDRIIGGPAIRGQFPPDAFGLTLEDRKALQTGLKRAGFDAGTPDGVLGSKTEAAIRGYQTARGLPVTGEPSQTLVQALR